MGGWVACDICQAVDDPTLWWWLAVVQGKTLVLKEIARGFRQQFGGMFKKAFAVAAPTGIAAVNAGGEGGVMRGVRFQG